jgi:hypothetical protein
MRNRERMQLVGSDEQLALAWKALLEVPAVRAEIARLIAAEGEERLDG